MIEFDFRITSHNNFLVQIGHLAVIIPRRLVFYDKCSFDPVEGTNTDPDNPNTLTVEREVGSPNYYRITVTEFGSTMTIRVGKAVFDCMVNHYKHGEIPS